MVKTREITGKELSDFLGVSASQYEKCPVDEYGHTFVRPEILLKDDNVIKYFPVLIKKQKGKIRSGDVWYGPYDTTALYIGKTERKKDVLIDLGGDTIRAGCVNIDTHSRRWANFEKKIFSPFKK